MGGRSRREEKGRFVDGPFVPLTLDVMHSAAWRALKPEARLVYLLLRSKLNRDPRFNNGQIFLSNRNAAEEINIAQRTAWKAFHELQAKGFVVTTQVGHLGAEGMGRATCFRITECGTKDSYEGTKDYRRWSPGNDFPVVKGNSPVRKEREPLVEDGAGEARVIPLRRSGGQ
jgi:hypothetical protein